MQTLEAALTTLNKKVNTTFAFFAGSLFTVAVIFALLNNSLRNDIEDIKMGEVYAGSITYDKLADDVFTTVEYNLSDGTTAEAKVLKGTTSEGLPVGKFYIQLESGGVVEAEIKGNAAFDITQYEGDIKSIVAGQITAELNKLDLSPGTTIVNKTITVDLGPDSVNTINIINGAVTSDKITNDAITEDKLADDAVSTNKLVDGVVDNSKLADSSVDTDKLADNSVDSSKLVDGTVDTSDLADDSVDNNKLADNSVDNSKLADNSVNGNKIADNSVNTNVIVNGTITDDDVSAIANIAWGKINKVGSSIADLSTRNAADVTIADVGNFFATDNVEAALAQLASVAPPPDPDLTYLRLDATNGPITGNLLINADLDVTGTINGNLTGNITGDVFGNADTVTNGVYTNGSYADPAWITSLGGSKISGDITGNSANVTGIVALANGGTGANLVAPAGDRILFYDQSAGSSSWLDLGTNLSITDTTINAVDLYNGTVTSVATGNGLSGGPITATGTISINSPTCAGTDKLQWNGTAFLCSADVDTDTNTTYTNGNGLDLTGTTFSLGNLTSDWTQAGAFDVLLGAGTFDNPSVNADLYVNGNLETDGIIVGNLTGNVTGNVSGTAANITGTVAVLNGGTGATDAATARTNLGITAGGAGDIWVEKAGDTMTGDLTFSDAQKIIGGTSTTADLSLQTTSGVGATGADMHFLVGNNGATEAMTILNGGNVGIGTTTPGVALDVVGSIKSSALTSGRVTLASTGGLLTDSSYMTFTLGNPINNLLISSAKSVEFDFQRATTADSARMFFKTGDFTYNWLFGMIAGTDDFSIADGISGGARFRITPGAFVTGDSLVINGSTGNVGIGTAAPGSKLQINTSADATIGQIIRANSATQTGNLTEWQNSSGTAYAWVDPTGGLIKTFSNLNGVNSGFSQMSWNGFRTTTRTSEGSTYAGLYEMFFNSSNVTGRRGISLTATLTDNTQNATSFQSPIGGYFSIANASNTSITETSAAYFDYSKNDVGTQTRHYAIRAGTAVVSSGTLENFWGLKIENQTAATNNIAIETGIGDVKFGDSTSINGSDAAAVQLIVKGASAQSADLTQWQNSSGTLLSSIDASGNLVFNGTTKVIGGTSTTSDLTLQTTTGVGTTGADMHFLVGNNGATEAMSILNSGNVGIGTTNPSSTFHINKETASSVPIIKLTGVGNYPGSPTDSANGVGIGLVYNVAGNRQFWIGDSDSGSGIRINGYNLAGWNYATSTDASMSIGGNGMNTTFPSTGSVLVTGSVGIGTTSPDVKLDVGGDIEGSLATSSDGTGQVCYATGGVNGGAYLLTRCASSSERYKENIQNSTLGLSSVLQLRPVTFNYKSAYSNDGSAVGFIAEEVEQISPLLVNYNTLGQIEGVKYDKVTALLTRAIQEQQIQIEELKEQVQMQNTLPISYTEVSNLSATSSTTTTTEASSVDISAINAQFTGAVNIVNELNVGTNAVIKGTLTADSVNVISNLIVGGQIKLNSNVTNTATIDSGNNQIDVMFTEEYSQIPMILATPYGESALIDGLQYTIINITENGFSIKLNKITENDIAFTWLAVIP